MALTVMKREGMNLRIHESLDELRTDIAEYIAQISEACVKERGSFVVALSGGSLIDLIRKLYVTPYNKTVDWAKWRIFWSDERVVSKSHADSNYKLAKDNFLSKLPVILSHVHSINDSLSAEEAANEYEFVIRQLVKSRIILASDVSDCPKFDLILLGMGSDGHVASIFPNHPVLEETVEWVTFLTDSPESPPERITFTLPVINAASNVAVVATGGDKAEAVSSVVDGEPDSPSLPAKMVRPIQGQLTWFLDEPAASKIKGFQVSG